MYKVGIVGHGPEEFSDHNRIERKIFKTLDLLKFQYGQDLIVNIGSEIGVGQWAGNACATD